MAQHKWHKEIKAWADGAEIEIYLQGMGWQKCDSPYWDDNNEAVEYRIKPHP